MTQVREIFLKDTEGLFANADGLALTSPSPASRRREYGPVCCIVRRHLAW